jgi:hypothetical protein
MSWGAKSLLTASAESAKSLFGVGLGKVKKHNIKKLGNYYWRRHPKRLTLLFAGFSCMEMRNPRFVRQSRGFNPLCLSTQELVHYQFKRSGNYSYIII